MPVYRSVRGLLGFSAAAAAIMIALCGCARTRQAAYRPLEKAPPLPSEFSSTAPMLGQPLLVRTASTESLVTTTVTIEAGSTESLIPGATAVPGEAAGAATPAAPTAQPGEGAREEIFLRAQLENQQKEQAAQVKRRIAYPDKLHGGIEIRSATKAGLVTFFYPLRSMGGVAVKVGKEHAVEVLPVSDASTKALLDTVGNYLQKDSESVRWYGSRNMLEITAMEENVPFLLDLLEFLDTPTEQIIIEASVWEVTDTTDEQIGSKINIEKRQGGGSFFNMFTSTADTQAFFDTLTSGRPFEGGTLEFLAAAERHHAKMDFAFQFLKTLGHADLMSQPRMRVAVGQTAKILTGEEIPFETPRIIADKLEVITTYKPVGVQLFVTPMVSGQGSITLSVVPVVSEVIGYTDPGPNGVINPIIGVREAQTQVTVADKELIIIGGLNQKKKVTQERKVPILGDIPILKYLFSSRRVSQKTVQLWFTVQPTIAGEEHRIIRPELTGPPPLTK